MTNTTEKCPKCNADLSPVSETPNGRKLQRCSKGSWNPATKSVEGCVFVKWLPVEPKALDEKCPKCGAGLVLQVTRFGKKMKKCEKGGWDKEAKKATGCDYVEWITGTSVPLDTKCPDCGENLVLFTTNSGKKLEKCSTAGWDKVNKMATGCEYVKWLRPGEQMDDKDEVPPPPEE